MKKLAYILLSLLLLLTPLFAQAALVATYQGNANFGLGTYKSPLFPSVPIGTAFANREALFLLVWPYNLTLCPITGLTINGTPATGNQFVVTPNDTWAGSFIWAWAAIPSGTTASVDLTNGSSSCNGLGNAIVYAYTFDYTLAAASPTHAEAWASSNVSSLTNTLNTTANGFLITAIHTWTLTSITALGISASTETFTSDNVDNSNRRGVASKTSGTGANIPSSVTWSWSTNAVHAYATMLFWGAAPSALPTPARHMLLFEGYKIKFINGKLKINQQ